jgi:hypothetical protein
MAFFVHICKFRPLWEHTHIIVETYFLFKYTEYDSRGLFGKTYFTTIVEHKIIYKSLYQGDNHTLCFHTQR